MLYMSISGFFANAACGPKAHSDTAPMCKKRGEPMKPMTVLLTGGSGFLGSHIAEQLCQDGCRVRAIVRMTSDTSFLETLNNIEIIRLSMADTHGVREAVEGVDAIIHSAAVLKATHEETFKKVNVDYTINLLDAVSQTGTKLKRFVHISSLAAVGSSGTGEIIRNDDPATPLTRYGKSKLASEQAAKSKSDHIPITILRPVSLYGPRDRATLTMFNCVKHRFLPYLSSPHTRIMLLYGPDFARACIQAIHANVPSGASYLVDDGQVHTWEELLSTIESIMGKKAWVRFTIPRPLIVAVATVLDMYSKLAKRAFMLSRDKLQELCEEFVTDGEDACTNLKWRPKTHIREGLLHTLDWYRKNGWL